MVALNWVALTKVVVRAAPFQRTADPETKLLPLTVSVKAGPPAVALLGASEPSAGAAGGGAAATVKGNAPDAAPPGLSTETWAVPGAAMSAAAMAALN